MGILRAGFHGTVGQPSAQVIDGSLKFDRDSNNYLKKTISTTGNQRTFTVSAWFKKCLIGTSQYLFTTEYLGSGNYFEITMLSGQTLQVYNNKSTAVNVKLSRLLRDNGWFHVTVAVDTTIASPTEDRVKIYVNGERQTDFDATGGGNVFPALNYAFELSNSRDWIIGAAEFSSSMQGYYDGHMSNFYFVDGQALGPEEFGFTDPLTNTWRPKKFEGTTSPNDGTTWSNSLSGTANNTVDNPTNLFDNDITSYADRGSGSSDPMDYTFTPPSTIRANSSVRIYAFAANGHSNNHIKITYNNGVEVTKTAADLGLGNPGDLAWFDLSSYINFPADISSIEYRSISGGGQFGAIEIDGILLIDGLNDPKGFGTNGFYLPFDGNSPIGQDKSGNGNDFTPRGFGGSIELSKATGALPILNTTNGGNTGTVGVRTDVYANNLVLALPLVSNANDVSNQINSGSTTKSVTANNNVVSSDVQSNFYDGSFYFDGNTTETSAKYLEVASGLNFSQDFTVEMWFYKTTNQDWGVLFDCWNGQDQGGSGWYSWISGSAIDIVRDSSTYYYDSSDSVILNDTWNHVAYVRDNNVFKLFLNGVFQYSFNITDSWTSTKCWIGSGQGNTSMSGFYGYIQDVRIYQTAKYTENFVLASIDPDILPDTPSGVSGGSKLTKINDGSVYFDGNGDSLRVEDHVDFTFGGGDYTMEAFVYMDSNSTGFNALVTKYSTNTQSDRSWWWGLSNGRQEFYQYYNNGLLVQTTTSPKIIYNKWTHCAVAREGSTIRIFDDGQLSATIDLSSVPSSQTMNDGSGPLVIGRDADSNTYDMDGFISNVRVIKGTALYTSNFTPPTAPLTNVTNTKLLCCQSTTDVTEGAVKPADVSWVPTGYTYWSGMNDNWDVSGTTTSDISATGDGDWIATSLPTSGKYYFETIVNNPGQYRVIGFAIGQSGAGANYLDNMFGYYFNGTGTPPLFLTKNSSGTTKAATGVTHGDTSELTLHDGDILMWGWDADNDKIYFGLNGTWYNNGDPAAGTGNIIGGQDLSASSFYLKVGYMNSGGHSLNKLSLTNVPSSESGSSSSIVSSREISNFNLHNKASNFNPFNTDIDTVHGQETVYPTWNPLRVSGQTLSNNNMTTTGNGGNVLGSMFTPTSGKFYWEVIAGADYTMTGIQRENNYDMSYPGSSAGQIALYLNAAMGSGQLYEAGSITSNWGGGVAGDVIGVALDMDNNKVYFYNNGRGLGPGGITGTPIAVDVPIGGGYTANCRSGSGTSDGPSTINFGQTPFKFQPPDGFQPLNSVNIRPETVIARPDQYVGVTTYTGNAPPGSTNTQSFNIGFKPDLLWFKVRTATSNNFLFDTVRTRDKVSFSNTAANDSTCDSGKDLVSFDYNGFTVGEGNQTGANEDGEDIVAWAWKAGGNSNTYNVDNVGYSTSTDINMSIGALNSVSYDQSQTWSNLDTYPNSYSPTTPANLFNGVVSTGEADFWYSAGPSTVRFDNLVDQLPDIVNTVELYVYDRNGTITVTVNGRGATNYANTGTYKWIKLTPNQKIVTLTVSGSDTVYWGIGAIKINGVMLANAGVTPANVPSIAPTGCSVGTKQGFSIVGYEGNSVSNTYIPHGLTKKPQFILVKNRIGGYYWHVYHAGMGLKWAEIINSSTFADNANYWVQEPTDNVFTVGIANGINANGHQHIAYLWHDVPGLQKFGIYEGNADSGGDGPYVELGFKPAILMLKNADDTEHWYIYDSERSSYNPAYQSLMMSSNAVEESGTSNTRVDLLSSGFKLRQSNGPNNSNTYVYAAWAEAPSINLYGGTSNAR